MIRTMAKPFWRGNLPALMVLFLFAAVAAPVSVSAGGALRADLKWVKSWGYQLQDADIQQLADSPYDLLVIDYARDGTDAGAYTAEEIRRIQHAGKLVLAYLSIGEAEDYRFYWKDGWKPGSPDFLGPENPDWEGNFKVRYWRKSWWRKALRPFLDRILAAGFDGVYLDIIDAYDYWRHHALKARRSAGLMARMVAKIGKYARSRAGSRFIVCPQNGVGLIDDAPAKWRRRYLEAVDCIGVEDLYFNVWSPQDQAYRLKMLAEFDRAGKKIFDVEYIPPGKYDDYAAVVEAHQPGVVPYAADPDRELDEMLVHAERPPLTDKMDLWRGQTLLRGANIYQRRVYPELDGPELLGSGSVGPPYSQADFDRLAAMGANLVVISHPGLYGEKPPFALDAAVRDHLDRLLEMAARADLFAVIALRTGPGRSEFTFLLEGLDRWFDERYLNDSLWQSQEAQDAWVRMWRYIAGRYRNNPVVVGYDLMVEPNANEVGSHAVTDALDIWDPAVFYQRYRASLYDWGPLYRRITAAVREVDSRTPILIGPMGYSAVDWMPYMEITGDSRTVYTVHQYAPEAYTHQQKPRRYKYPGRFDTDGDGSPERFDRAWMDILLETVDDFKRRHGVPAAVTEFGAMRWAPHAAAFLHDEMALFEQRGMNHAIWLWETSWQPYNRLEDAFNFRHGPSRRRHREGLGGELQDVIGSYWRRNRVRPSNVDFP